MGPLWPFQALSGNRSGNQECVTVACWGCPRFFPCPTSRPSRGRRPQPDHSCLIPGSEVARKAGKAELFDFQAFPSPPGGRQPERQKPVTACPRPAVCSDRRAQMFPGGKGDLGTNTRFPSLESLGIPPCTAEPCKRAQVTGVNGKIGAALDKTPVR